MTSPEIRVFEGPTQLFKAAAAEFASLAQTAVRENDRFAVALSGGSTPKGMYSVLASGVIPNLPWQKTYFFWGDERHVPPDHPDSNFRMVKEALLSKVPVPLENIFRIHAELPSAEDAARAYERGLREFFHLKPGEFPRFDLVLLGLGPEGHTASLFPGSPALTDENHLVAANWVGKLNTDRITFTLPVLDNAKCIVFLASGKEKAAIVHQVLENPAADLPAQRVRPLEGRLIWMLDSAAAEQLSSSATAGT